MFLIAGISPKVKYIDHTPRRCPVCGLQRAYYKRVDHYISLFFIPLIKIKTGEPVLMCERCERAVSEIRKDAFENGQLPQCHNCGSVLGDDYKYCPYCGSSI